MPGLDGDEKRGARVVSRGGPCRGFRASASERDEASVPASFRPGRREIAIRHAGARYRLPIAANDEQILTR